MIRTYPTAAVFMAAALALTAAAFETVSGSAEGTGQRRPGYPETALEAPAQAGTWAPPEEAEKPEPVFAGPIRSLDWDAEESGILLRIAMAEAEGEGVEGKALVMLVVLNRVWSGGFPGTIEEVVFQPGQFSPVRQGGRYYTEEPDEGCYEALELVMGGWDESGGALYFESCGKSSWHSRNLEYLYRSGKHNFYR